MITVTIKSKITRKGKGYALSPRLSQSWHLTSRNWLEEELRKTDGWDKTVVVTHHLPHSRSLSEKFKCGPLNSAFAAEGAPIENTAFDPLFVVEV